MAIIRLSLAVASVLAALFCVWEASLIHDVNSRPHWLSGPLQVWGHTVPPNACISALGVLSIFFISIAAYAIFVPKSNN